MHEWIITPCCRCDWGMLSRKVCVCMIFKGKMKRQTLASNCDDLELRLYHYILYMSFSHPARSY